MSEHPDQPWTDDANTARAIGRLGRPTTLAEAAYRYCELSQRIHSEGTARLYRIWLTHFENFLKRPGVLDDLTDENFIAFVKWREKKVAHETLRGDCNKMLALWRWCASGKRRWIEPPDVSSPEPKYRLPQALDRQQLKALWDTAERFPYKVGTIPGNIFWPALLYVLWDTSERIGAAHQIDRTNIDLANGWITIEADARKGGVQPRIYRVRPETIGKMRRLLDWYPGVKPFAECSLNNLYKHLPYLRNEAGLPKWFTFHTLRKSHASHLAALGGDARASLGHSSNAITDRSYIDVKIAATGIQPCDVLFDPADGKPTSGLRALWNKLTGSGPKPAIERKGGSHEAL